MKRGESSDDEQMLLRHLIPPPIRGRLTPPRLPFIARFAITRPMQCLGAITDGMVPETSRWSVIPSAHAESSC
jgi:hypothetical protein